MANLQRLIKKVVWTGTDLFSKLAAKRVATCRDSVTSVAMLRLALRAACLIAENLPLSWLIEG